MFYDFLEKLGSGAFSTVFKARSEDDGTIVALKKVPLELMGNEARKSCLEEVNLLKKFDHPNVIKYLTFYTDECELNIVLELADADLSQMIAAFLNKRKHIREDRIWELVVQIGAGLEHMHSQRIMHRDLKPQNILFVGKVIKIGDLGLAKYFREDISKTNSDVGSLGYKSPERIQMLPYTFSSDIWSLGCTVFQFGALQPPFRPARLTSFIKKVLRGEHLPLPSSIYSNELRQIIDQCLQVEPKKRPSAREILEFAQKMCQKSL